MKSSAISFDNLCSLSCAKSSKSFILLSDVFFSLIVMYILTSASLIFLHSIRAFILISSDITSSTTTSSTLGSSIYTD